MTKNRLYYGDNLERLATIEKETVDLIYIDPPFKSNQDYNVPLDRAIQLLRRCSGQASPCLHGLEARDTTASSTGFASAFTSGL